MINQEQFHKVYSSLNLEGINAEGALYNVYISVFKSVIERSKNNPRVYYEEDVILDYCIQEFKYFLIGREPTEVNTIIANSSFINQMISIIADKVLFNEIVPYQERSFVSHQSPIISTMELNINFILDRLRAVKSIHNESDVVLDMCRKAFLMFKCINYQLTSSFETEAFSTWRTIHELECLIKVLYENENVIPTYYHHMVYSDAFRNGFKDKDEQQKVIEDLKANMKLHELKSKDMKKYIEYGWMYAVENLEKNYPDFKLNFRNGLETIAGLSMYSKDYEMASEVAHSSPILVYSNRIFFRYLTVVRTYESFIRLESIFFDYIEKKYSDIDMDSYKTMRKRYIAMCHDILRIESNGMKQYIASRKFS